MFHGKKAQATQAAMKIQKILLSPSTRHSALLLGTEVSNTEDVETEKRLKRIRKKDICPFARSLHKTVRVDDSSFAYLLLAGKKNGIKPLPKP